MSFVHRLDELIDDSGTSLTAKAQHWQRVPLRNIATVINGFPFSSKGFNNTTGTAVIRIRDIVAGRTSTFYQGPTGDAPLIEHGDLVIGMDGDFNSRLWPGESALMNQRVCKVVPDESVYSKRFLAYVLPGYLKLINDHTSAITVKHLSSKTVQDIPLPLPPRREQERIVSKIDELFSEIEEGERALERVQKLVQRYRQSVLKAAVTGELTREWRKKHKGQIESGRELLQRVVKARRAAWERETLLQMRASDSTPKSDNWKQKYPEPVPPNTTELPELPPEWTWASIDQVGLVSGGLTKNQKRDECELRRPFLRVANVYANRLDLTEVHEIGLSAGELDRVLLKSGDLLVVEGNGSVEQIGRVALWDGSIERCVHQNHLIKIRCTEVLPSWYALIWCMSPHGREQIRRVASSTSGLHTLSISKVQALPIPIPTGAELQVIQDRFQEMESLVTQQLGTISRQQTRAVGLRQAVLRLAFAGRLVPQDPTDEPATAFLERIAADRTPHSVLAARRGRAKKTAT